MATTVVLEDNPPDGWSIHDVSDEGVYDSVHHTVTFGPYADNLARTVTYRATPPMQATSPAVFTGTVSFEGTLSEIDGDSELPICPVEEMTGLIVF